MVANAHITGTGKTGSFGTTSGNSVRLRPEIDAQIAMVEPAGTPTLTVLNALNKVEQVGNPEYTVQEEWPIANVTNLTGDITAAATTLTVADSSFFIPGLIIMNAVTKEHCYVTAVPSAGNLTVVREFGTTESAAMSSGQPIRILAVATEEGQDRIQNRMRATASHTNYAEGFAHAAGLTDVMLRHAVYGPTEEVRLDAQGVLEFKKQQNRAFLLGEPKKDTTTGTFPIYATGGLRYYGSLHHNINFNGEFTWKTLASALMAIMRYGNGREYWGITSQKVWLEMTSLSEIRDQVRSTPQIRSVGFEINSITFPGGVLNLAVDYTLEGDGMDDEIVVVDMNHVSIAEFQGTSAEDNIQSNGALRKEWQMVARRGLKQRLPISSGVLSGLTTAG